MKVSNTKPPNWGKIRKAFDFDERHTVFTYGDTIHNPACKTITQDLVAHECVHEWQQAQLNVLGLLGPARWWRRYLKDPKFRFEQELEAYRVQYRFAKNNIKNREMVNKYLHHCVNALCGPMYGNLDVDRSEVMRIIKNDIK